jgi:16S rRNA G527 N7-methylase RsmG
MPYYSSGIVFLNVSSSNYKNIRDKSLLNVSGIAIGRGSGFPGLFKAIADAKKKEDG